MASGSETPNETELKTRWIAEQNDIASRVIQRDENEWAHFFKTTQIKADRDLTIAGTDISFSTEKEDLAIGTLAIVKLRKNGDVNLVYSKSHQVKMPHPYIPGFLGFREAPAVAELLQELPPNVRASLDCLLLDGNGLLHPRKAGLACQVGVQEDIPTIGVSKALLCVDGLNEREVRQLAGMAGDDGVDVVGASGFVWGRALLTGNAQTKPIYVSIGHKVTLQTASRLVQHLCDYRVPSPIREADLHSRSFLRDDVISIYRPEEFIYTALSMENDT